MAEQRADLFSELPHIIVLLLLLLVLLFVATKFKYVHCSQLPQWCNVYCNIAGHSRVAIITGEGDDAGMGNGDTLERILNQNSIGTLVTRLKTNEISSGNLEDYELVVFTQSKNISLRSALAIRDYLNKGGSLLWEGDALSQTTFTEDDQAYLLAENRSSPGEYEAYVKLLNYSQGFGVLGQMVGIRYVASLNTVNFTGVTPRILSVKDNLITGGIKNFELETPVPFAQVVEDPKAVTKVMIMNVTKKEYAFILEKKLVGRVVYTAIPVEYLDSKTLLLNLFEYMVTC